MRLAAILILGATPWFPIWTEAEEPPPATDAETMVRHMEQVAVLVEQHGNDCTAAAEALSEYEAVHGDELRAASQRLDKLPEDEQAELQNEFRPRLEAAVKKMSPGIANCRGHRGFNDAMVSLSTAPPKPTDLCRKWQKILNETESDTCEELAAGLDILEPAEEPLDCAETLAEVTRERCPDSSAISEDLMRLLASDEE